MTEKKSRIWVWWVIAGILTLATGYYQRVTGPTYDKKINFTLDGQEYKVKLPRSHGDDSNCPVVLPLSDSNYSATLIYRRFQFDKDYTEVPFERSDSTPVGFTSQTTTGRET
ncbi:MAG: hypothetical protein IPJ75_13515 [Ignavibacteriales bacterium]|nr:hypothetical protein [Ignavibacteriales bacterium]